MWEHGDFVNKGTLIILSLMSIGSWYIIITKLIDQQKVMNQAKDMKAKFWKAPSIVAGSATLKEGSPFRFIAETGTKATQHHDGALLEQIDLSTWTTMQIQRAVTKSSRVCKMACRSWQPSVRPRRSSVCSVPSGASTTH